MPWNLSNEQLDGVGVLLRWRHGPRRHPDRGQEVCQGAEVTVAQGVAQRSVEGIVDDGRDVLTAQVRVAGVERRSPFDQRVVIRGHVYQHLPRRDCLMNRVYFLNDFILLFPLFPHKILIRTSLFIFAKYSHTYYVQYITNELDENNKSRDLLT